jgi:hypothetical protein
MILPSPRPHGRRRERLACLGLCAALVASCGPPDETGLDERPDERSDSAVQTKPGLSARALSPWAVRLHFAVPPRADSIQIFRNGRRLDRFPAGAASTYTDQLLWATTSYTYSLAAYDGTGKPVARYTTHAKTPAPKGPIPRLYSDASFWNLPIPSGAEIDPGSTGVVAHALLPYRAGANLVTTDAWGTPIAYANPASRLYSIGCTTYDCETDVRGRLPRYARPSTGSDGHLVVIDPSSNTEIDLWQGAYDGAHDAWSAASRYRMDPKGLGSAPPHSNAATAAGFALAGGKIRPEEIAQGHIDHALFLTSPYIRAGFIACPATHTDGRETDPRAIPEGARVQLDPTFDVGAQPWPRWKKVIARALQRYGAFVGDTGGTLAIFAESNRDRAYDAWAKVGIASAAQFAPSLSDLPWEHMRVLRLRSCD